MDKNEVILLSRPAICRMLGGISRGTFYNWRKKWDENGTPFPAPVDVLGTGKGVMYRYQDVMKFFKSIGLLSDSDNQ
ncbi:helix-turn-helix domain-containing protein [Escherichia coli]|uniref:helix-turn-helix transcriptional regulator n=1 Tax=Escherichia coli TaxID=562 RepID=UPI001385889A|nr:helix-turn-helix domain-containing protein [Escherichia coli]EKD4358861.1 helix-turn-helix domain-containing protein [Escherichia coli]MZZ32683.1 helix-turn-helix domain-containing protein [Escherichia coli]NAB59933.1 helix-turn-helix domain-containing protein [Escherichia coli]NAC01760.1 helix-turn-helix domain-containing protein [Escherichia coli]